MTDNPPAGIHPLHERLARAFYDEAPTWEHTFPEGNKGEVMGVPDAVVVAARTVEAWLREEAEMRDSSWLPTDHYAMEDHRPIVARALLVLADAIYPKEAHDGQ